MSTQAWLLLAAYSIVLVLLAIPMGRVITHVMEGRLVLVGRIEAGLHRLCGIRADAEMGWLQYALAILLFNGLGVLAVYALQRLQLWLPLNPQGLANVSPDSSFNTALSFVTNTNWQGYSGEQTMSHLTQMLGLAVQNFLSAATGTGLYGMLVLAILAVFIAGLMIGRTPEYLGKKIEAHEMKMTSVAILVTPLLFAQALIGKCEAPAGFILAHRELAAGRHGAAGRWPLRCAR